MSWVRIDDQFADHPKVVGLTPLAFRLHITGLCYAARQETDGIVPRGAAFITKRYAAELVVAGLWEPHPAGYRIHDYLDYNPTKAELDSKRDSKRMAGAKGAASRWHGGTHGSADSKPMAPSPAPPRPAPVPRRAERDDEQQPRAHEAAASESAEEPVIYRLHREHFGSPNGKLDELRRYEETGPAVLEMAFAEAAAGGGRSWWYVKSILERWEAAGILDDPRAVELDRLQQEVG